MGKIIGFIKERLGEKSTVITLVTLVSGLVGFSVAPEQLEAITGAVAAILALVGVFTKEAK
jgi:hypothetical protein